MRIGIGITTTKSRPKTFALCMRQFKKHIKPTKDVEFVMHVQYHYPKHSGIAAVKNDCLRELMNEDCDFLYLFDDDCFPIRDDWWAPFIEAHARTEQHHFLWLMEDIIPMSFKNRRRKTGEQDGITIFHNAQGCCMFFTKMAVLAAGAFDERYTYGYEHENYSLRLFQLGMNTIAPMLSVPGIEKYIYSLDVQTAFPYQDQLGKEYNPRTRLVRSAAGNSDIQYGLKKGAEEWMKEAELTIAL